MHRITWLPAVVRTSLGCLVLVLAAGCGGPKLQNVKGTVTIKGQPVPAGVVRIHGPGARLATADLKPDGTFNMTDVLPGVIKVSIMEVPGGASQGGSPFSGASAGRPTPAPPPALKRVPIPRKYQDVASSGLTYTITPTTEQLEIKLE